MQKKANFFEDNLDTQFQFFKRVDFKTLFSFLTDADKEMLGVSTVEAYRSLWADMLHSIGELAGTVIAPNASQVEKQELKLTAEGDVILPAVMRENLAKIKELGICGLSVEPSFGGIGAPFLVEMVAGEIVCRACPATFLNAVWYGPIAEIIHAFGDAQTQEAFIPKLAAGEWSGSMALTEADAGSDLAALRTYGEVQEIDGSWKLYGSKRFISNGCGDLTLALAKNKKGAEGLHNLSLYIVQRKVNGAANYTVTRVEDKPGLHGSPTCELKFDGSRAILLGKNGEGFSYMLKLMNDARLGVAFQGVGMLEGIFRMTDAYANQRIAWGKPIAEHELIAEKLLDMEVDLAALRSLSYQAAEVRSVAVAGERYLQMQKNISEMEAQRIKKLVKKMHKRLRAWTPLLKWWVGEKVFQHARNGLQIHGGYGFTKEYRAEWWVRESLILSIYEGTSQIQALMAVKDTLKEVIRRPVDFVEVALGSKLQGLAETNPLRRKYNRLKQITNSAVVALLLRLVRENVKASLSETKRSDILKMVKVISRDIVKFENLSPALLQAERICEMKATLSMAKAVLEDAEKDLNRAWIAERFMNKSLPQLMRLKEEIELDDRVLAGRLQAPEKKRVRV